MSLLVAIVRYYLVYCSPNSGGRKFLEGPPRPCAALCYALSQLQFGNWGIG